MTNATETKIPNRGVGVHDPNPEVLPKAARRQYSADYKQRILTEADGCTQAGQIGALLRREGLYASHLAKWREQRERGASQGLQPAQRGRKADPLAAEIAQLKRENERLKAKLERAELIIEVQKKVSQIFASAPTESTNNT